MHRPIIIFHNLVTETKRKLTRSKIGKQIAFPRDISSKIAIYPSNLPGMYKPLLYLWANPIVVWNVAREAIRWGKS
jgi:hypothetical protein